MKKLAIWIAYIGVFIFFTVIFVPKNYLYYKFEHILQKERIVISDEKVVDNPFSLHLQKGSIYIKSINTASFKDISLYPLILLNVGILRDFQTSKELPLPQQLKVKKAFILYSPFFPIKAFIKAQSSFGQIDGWINPIKKRGSIDIYSKEDLSRYKNFLPLTKVKEGLYRYEFSF